MLRREDRDRFLSVLASLSSQGLIERTDTATSSTSSRIEADGAAASLTAITRSLRYALDPAVTPGTRSLRHPTDRLRRSFGPPHRTHDRTRWPVGLDGDPVRSREHAGVLKPADAALRSLYPRGGPAFS
ncbi:hypothetical protein [Natrinema caseinilyticum]|uniref:hypothetical protein n=1 Tax=Natrinema caseinilyticum TaxID=2961570 RepID=UPI0020C4049E|nr:hypothetical protein [Natrinema caseinilyticum]